MNLPSNVTPQQLRRAADIQERIQGLQHELVQILGSNDDASAPGSGKRRLSAQGLANIRAGARRRWAKARTENGTSGASRKPKRKMSAAGREAIAARMRARWAAAKRSGRNAL
jgi:hypothetical protein